MISPSLRNLRTILWSMLPTTSRHLPRTLTSRQDPHRKFISDISPTFVAFLATCTILTGVNITVAQESAGRAALSESADPLNPATLTGPVPQPVLRSTPGPRRSTTTTTAEVAGKRQIAGKGAKASASRNSAGRSSLSESSRDAAMHPSTDLQPGTAVKRRTAATAVSSTQTYHGPEANSNVGGNPPVPPDTLQPNTWQQEYSSHVDEVLTGDPYYSERGTIGDWWRHRLPYVDMVPVEPGRLHASARNFIDKHSLPPEHDYVVDVYDQKPISVASSRTVTTVRPLAAEPDDEQAANEPGKNRLRTDIRKIRPTLSYAMRNIDAGQLPEGFDEKLDGGDYVARQSSPAVLQWAPTNLYHYPLYFEDPALERYGHTYHPVVQPFASAGRFATQLVGLPYQMALHPVHSHEYTLGYYRPGECAPKKHYQIPFNEEAAIMQAAAMAGFFLIFP